MISAIENALSSAGLSQRDLAARTGLSQSTVHRILKGERNVKMPELIRIADAIGCTVAQLTGEGVAKRVVCAARSTNGAKMDAMRQRLLHFMELEAYLDDQAIAEVL